MSRSAGLGRFAVDQPCSSAPAPVHAGYVHIVGEPRCRRVIRFGDDRPTALVGCSRCAAVVVREADGRFWVPKDEERIGFTGTATGGAIGAILGALIGPVGLLFWGATGALVGSLADSEEADVSEHVLASVTNRVPRGTTALVADVDEPATQLVDAVMEAASGRVSRRPRADIEAELEAADEAVRAARREADRVLRERRKAAGEETLGDRLHDLKEKVIRAAEGARRQGNPRPPCCYP